MYENLVLFQTAVAKARHAGQAQALVARNIANADTPGFRAQHLAAFDPDAATTTGIQMRKTRAAHLQIVTTAAPRAIVDGMSEPSPNGNSVAIEEEMLAATRNVSDHTQALAIFRHAMNVLRTSIGR